MTVTINGLPALEKKLRDMDQIAWGSVVDKNLKEIFNRGARPPGTPVRTNELVKSRRISRVDGNRGVLEGSFGYKKEYGPHVEFGHRIVRKGKEYGFVVGNKYLYNNVKKQRQIYRKDMLEALRKG